MSVFVIAEAGVNHGGKLRVAFQLAEAAKAAGADAVKFQLFDAAILKRESLEALQLSYDEMRLVAVHCDRIGIEFMCTPFDVDALHFLTPLVKRMKIASGFITNMPFLQAAAALYMPLIISTGMADRSEILNAYTEISLNHDITWMHCTSAYPCPVEDVNLRAMGMLPGKKGYSDHTDGIAVPIAAVALGATVIEKHLTLDRTLPGPDHKASITPREFRAMVMAIHDIENALGDGVKRPMPSEEPVRRIWRGVAA